MESDKSALRRCAVYTRKSSEEGLEQDFNSLHAQREACEAFIKSQTGEGWRLVKTAYDDGGLSGGNMERPALKLLLDHIEQGLIDVVVVYKVDRLTRSLADFAKMVEVFDAHGISFVAVTQQFNTTTSMGRLTLNVLLSFAQFEREVTGERIRDKIAASKRKGMWMGGCPPLGYDVVDRRLVINPKEAELVKLIYETYLRLGSVRLLKEHLERQSIISKIRTSKTGSQTGGCSFSRGALYELLANPLYIGEVRHRKERHRRSQRHRRTQMRSESTDRKVVRRAWRTSDAESHRQGRPTVSLLRIAQSDSIISQRKERVATDGARIGKGCHNSGWFDARRSGSDRRCRAGSRNFRRRGRSCAAGSRGGQNATRFQSRQIGCYRSAGSSGRAAKRRYAGIARSEFVCERGASRTSRTIEADAADTSPDPAVGIRNAPGSRRRPRVLAQSRPGPA
jgi:DNA invertase Pin-like site-specific DNA recombinase